MLRVVWNEELEEIHVQLMGEYRPKCCAVWIEERFGVKVSFDSGNIVYKETIKNTVEGGDIMNRFVIMQRYIDHGAGSVRQWTGI